MSQPAQTRLLRGAVRNLRKERVNQDFFFTETDRAMMGATAVAAGLSGLGGIATGLGGMAMDTTEEADLIEFDLDERRVKAWLWTSVFNEGDEIEVVAEQSGDIWKGYGIRRSSDGIVALHPHCSRGRYAHFRASLRIFINVMGWFFIAWFAMGFLVGLLKGLTTSDWKTMIPLMLLASLITSLIFGVIAFRIARKYMGFVRLAEGIFACFGWKDVKSIDLPALTKKTKGPNDPGPLGVLYFRYQP